MRGSSVAVKYLLDADVPRALFTGLRREEPGIAVVRVPMDFADASLVAICERLGIREIASIDRHFFIFRYKNRSAFKNVLV